MQCIGKLRLHYIFYLLLEACAQDLLGIESSEALKKLTAAAETEKDLKHQLGKVKFAAKEFEDSYQTIYKSREDALAKVNTHDFLVPPSHCFRTCSALACLLDIHGQLKIMCKPCYSHQSWKINIRRALKSPPLRPFQRLARSNCLKCMTASLRYIMGKYPPNKLLNSDVIPHSGD